MSLSLIYITNNPAIALIAEKNGVDRIMIDLETLGKEERQKNMNTVKSNHSVSDIAAVSKVLTRAKTLVRIDPWNDNSVNEIETVIASGADSIMLPMWKSEKEAELFLQAVNRRTRTILLLETREAVNCVDLVLENPLVDSIYIGLNDLHLSYGLTFMFELLSNGVVESLCRKFKAKGISYGFGGIARIGEGTLPAEKIVMEHYRLGSGGVILSRSFCNAEEIGDEAEVQAIFAEHIEKLREYEKTLPFKTDNEYAANKAAVKCRVAEIVGGLKERQAE